LSKADVKIAPDGLMVRCEEMIRIEDREAREEKADGEAIEEMIIIDDQNCFLSDFCYAQYHVA
jgi:hypothetical protein